MGDTLAQYTETHENAGAREWGRLETKVEQLGRVLDRLQESVPKAFKDVTTQYQESARQDREQLFKAVEVLRNDFMRTIKDGEERNREERVKREAQYREDQRENKAANARSMQIYTGIIVILGLLQALPAIKRLFGERTPS